jgi:predicted RNA-binding protein with PUA-like domain
MPKEMQYWLIKSEPESYGIGHLKRDKKTPWTGVRNFQARNFMRDGMSVGDTILYYHSNCKVPGVYGLAKVSSKPYPDPTQFVAGGHYHDPRASVEKPIWFVVDVEFLKEFKEPIPLTTIRETTGLGSMMILQRGSRLSVTPVDETHAKKIISMAS